MENEFVTYEQALALKELGFDEPCLRVGNPNGHTMWKFIDVGDMEGVGVDDILKEKFDDRFVEIPLKQQVFRWFRKTYKFKFIITEYEDDLSYYCINNGLNVGFNTYEEAESACIDKLLEIVKNK